MKHAIILHGTPSKEEYYSEEYPSQSNSHWLPWLQKQLLMRDIDAKTPEMFKSYLPKYELWREEFERYEIDEETILIGHSRGGGFLLRWLSEDPKVKVDKVILVAPWLDPFNEKEKDFFDFELDETIVSRARKFLIYNSSNDSEDIKESLRIIKEKIKNVEVKDFENYGHFCYNDLGSEKFPELLEEVLR